MTVGILLLIKSQKEGDLILFFKGKKVVSEAEKIKPNNNNCIITPIRVSRLFSTVIKPLIRLSL